MSDKGFGDHISRGVVKNPLLSSTVTGLSIEDLTHNTVLLPAVPSQEVIARQDKQCGPQNAALANPNQNIPNFPYGDANSNITQPNAFANVNLNASNINRDSQNNRIKESPSSTQSKAPLKSEDDFDVNEYFARLQGTRYVSAPLNSAIKDDKNANLQAEENLEEINLNEPERIEDVQAQNSLTADIAQNFSQLPTVLPQVASAVFSSFSSMLSMKARETTDVGSPKTEEVNVAFSVPEVARSVAPPPLQEPPSVGTSNYRITTKKKVYAQIPGLTGDAQNPHYNATHQGSGNFSTPPNIFNPQSLNDQTTGDISAQNTTLNTVETVDPTPFFIPESIPSQNSTSTEKVEKQESVYNFFTPMPDTQRDMYEKGIKNEPISSIESNQTPQTDTFQVSAPMGFTPTTSASIIPPPPMFSNVQRRDSQGSVGRTVLPPSVARRISANQPVIKHQAPALTMQENIFVPTFVETQNQHTDASHMLGYPETMQPYGIPGSSTVSSNVATFFDPSKPRMVKPEEEVTSPVPTFDIFAQTKTPITTQSGATDELQKPLEVTDIGQLNLTFPQAQIETNASQYEKGSLASTIQSFSTYPQAMVPPSIPSTTQPINQSAPSNMTIQPTIEQTVSKELKPNTNQPPLLFNPTQQPDKKESTQFSSESNQPPPLFFSTAIEQNNDTGTNQAPPLFFNPAQQNNEKDPLSQNSTNQHINQNPPPIEPPRTVLEPPKITGNLNLRMTKKRPQYYSAPIEGVGSISNNVKPTLNPVNTDAFQGALFTPSQVESVPNISEAQNIPNIDTTAQLYSSPPVPPYNYTSIAQEQSQTDYNTAFDLSRPTTEKYNPPEPENKGFGLLGSLKSKLSSIDINKIQNTVTTFFDPAYNEAAKETTYKPETSYPNQMYGNNYAQDSSSFDIFVGDYSRMQPALNFPSDYNPQYTQPNMYVPESNYEEKQYPVIDVAWQDNTSEYIEQFNVHPPSYGHMNLIGTTIGSGLPSSKTTEDNSYNYYETQNSTATTNLNDAPINTTENVINTTIPHISSAVKINNPLSLFSAPFVTSESPANLDDKIIESVTNLVLNSSPPPNDIINVAPEIEKPVAEILTNPPIENTFKLFDSHPLLPSDENVVSEKTFIVKDEIDPDYEIRTQSMFSSFEESPIHSSNPYQAETERILHDANIAPKMDPTKDIESDNFSNYFETSTIGTSEHLFAFSNLSTTAIPSTSPASTELTNIEHKIHGIMLHDPPSHSSESQKFPNTAEDLPENVSELNICVTCREVAKPEEKEIEDLTTQLIENIVAPIQLLNPVAAKPEIEHDLEIPLTEPIDPLSVTHISEDVINDIPVQSATDLLGDITIDGTINYGWNSDINNLLASNTLVEHDYSLQPDQSAIGFLPNKSLFFENIPTNASDEIKAEFKNSHEETIVPQPLIPTAPPEEDNKSDESGLDVLSIEQDAKKDFPIYDEFVIEPSETDDDKIEFMEREKSTEDSSEADTFTHRVERFKQMETVETDEVFESQIVATSVPSTTSPAITIASYFDTGNYAVENHYRNSLSSPTTFQSFTSTMRIPPGFEKEYQRRLSGVSKDLIPDSSSQDRVKFVPDTTTQTSVSPTITFTRPLVIPTDVTHVTSSEIKPTSAIETILTKPIEEPIVSDVERLPAFSSLTGQSQETFDDNDGATAKEIPIETKNLPDPLNFFETEPETSKKDDEYNSFSRLSSYFTTPPKSDNPKSFFELSQSQNHYRHASLNSYDPSSNETHKALGITQERYLDNLNLIRDLANYKDTSPVDNVVRTINYFTVEYDKENSNDSIGETSSILTTDKDVNRIGINTHEISDEEIIKQCKNCCNFKDGCVVNFDLGGNFRVRKCVDSVEERQRHINMEGESESHRQAVTVNFMEGVSILSENRGVSEYSPVKHHWFYRVDKDGNSIWRGFSVADSRALELAFTSSDLNENTLVATDGGRYDVNVVGRLRTPVYWTEKPTNVRRCSWFYKGNTDARYVPYTEPVAEKLEEEYRHGVTTGEWHRRLVLPNNELVVMHGPAVMVHFLHTGDSFNSSPTATRPRVVRRGCAESEIEDTEPSKVDHLLLLCHGVGSACDMRMRALEAVVNDFRTTSLQLLQSHYKNSYDSGLVGRVEVLPISWHSRLHSRETGVDRRLAAVTLESIPWLRGFTNDTLLDVLFYTSPVFCQTIIDTVCSELNRIYKLFRERNPEFSGGVSLGGHSLGSVILYDLLGHQIPEVSSSSSTEKTFVEGYAGTGQPMVKYPKLDFHPETLYALGSPIAIFECIRGVEMLGDDFCLPTCKNFFNIFHPYDPIAYRIEPMINSALKDVKPFLIPHHKGRKRMHLELKDTMTRFGADVKQKLVEYIKTTWSSMWKSQPMPSDQLEKVVEEELEKDEEVSEEFKESVSEEKQEICATPEMLGRLNGGRRIDYVLQEAPFEMINEYLFAMTSHVCYWESEDTILLILREIYDSLKVDPDSSLPQQSMTVQRTRTVTHDGVVVSTSIESPSTSRGPS